MVNGKECVNFASFNFLGLLANPRVKVSIHEAEEGAVTASRKDDRKGWWVIRGGQSFTLLCLTESNLELDCAGQKCLAGLVWVTAREPRKPGWVEVRDHPESCPAPVSIRTSGHPPERPDPRWAFRSRQMSLLCSFSLCFVNPGRVAIVTRRKGKWEQWGDAVWDQE